MSGPSLSPLADPASLAKIQILLVPVHTSSPGLSTLSESTFEYWTSRIRQHHVLRGDELWRPKPTPLGHARGIPGSDHPRTRFFPSGTGNSISRSASLNHVHLAYPSHPPARHLYPLSLLRMAAFPLVVIGIAADSEHGNGNIKGYSLDEDDDSGDIGDVKTPTAPTFQHEEIHQHHHPRHDPASAFDDTLSNLLPETSPFPLVKRLIMVPRHTPQSPSPGPSPSSSNSGTPGRTSKLDDQHSASGDLVVSHAPLEGADTWIGRILGEVVGQVLGELGELAVALETPSGLRTLSSTLLPSLTSTLPGLPDRPSTSSRSSTPTSELPSRRHTGTPSSTIPQSQSVESLNGMGITLTRALTPGGRPTSVGPPSLPPIQTTTVVSSSAPTPHSSSANPFRRSTAIHSPFSRTSSAASTSSNASATSSSTQVGSVAKYTSAPLAGVAGGRLLKLLGDMYLMAGMYGDAIRCFDEGAEKCRVVGDVLWEALAREGRAVAGIGEAWEGMDGSDNAQPFPTSPIPVEILNHFLSSLACLSRAPLPFPQTILSPSPQAASGSISFAPSSSKSAHLGTGEGLLAYLHTSLTLRIAHFQLLIWAAGGWGSVALSALMGHSLPRSFLSPLSEAESRDPVARRKHRRHTCMLSARSGLSRHSVFAHAELALSPHHRAMTKAEQLSVHVEAVWCARWLQLPRKEAHVTREVVKRVGSMIVEGREETRRSGINGFTRSKPSMPTKEAVSASIGLGIGMTGPAVPAVGVRRRESAEGNLAVISLFERSAAILGIDLLSFSTSLLPHVQKYMDKAPTSTDLNRFGWPELQVETMKEGIAIAEALPDHASVVRLCTAALKNLYGYLSPQSQGHLARMFPQALGVMRRRGMEFGGMMWWLPGRVVLSIEVAW
ncbi:hypothetical protein BCR39DRAFT_526584 [Naematelia encephala]|uniref:Uncharacterized protein n=1 Tax=Naematelia encephala TaxID=71784 RepID=A0A1Y2BAC5_9TREE|nr:hypothetical protein BCR39DRAFT_526584 [Naematelia encephala]